MITVKYADEQYDYNVIKNHLTNLVARLSSLRSSLEEETLVNAGDVAPRFWESACEG